MESAASAVVGAFSINAFKGCLNKIKKKGWASSWTDPLNPRPPWLVFWLVRPHKVSNKVSNSAQLNRELRTQTVV